MFNKEYFKDYNEQAFKWKFWANFAKKYSIPEDSILALGCAYGFLFKYLKEYNNLTGIDISEHAMEEAKKLHPHAKFEVMDANQLTFKDNSFQLIFCLDTLEHLNNPKECIKECYRTLKKNGHLIITTPNPESYSLKKKGLGWFAYKDETHVSIKHKKHWVKMLKEQGFTIEKAKSMDTFDAPYFKKVFTGINLLSYKIKHPFVPKGDNTFILAKKR